MKTTLRQSTAGVNRHARTADMRDSMEAASTDCMGSQENVETHFNQPREDREPGPTLDDTKTQSKHTPGILVEIESRLDRWRNSGIEPGPKGQDNDWPKLRKQARIESASDSDLLRQRDELREVIQEGIEAVIAFEGYCKEYQIHGSSPRLASWKAQARAALANATESGVI